MSLAAPVSARPEAPSSLPLVLIALGGGITGFSPLLARISELGPLATAGWRMALASLALMPFVALGGRIDRGSAVLIGLAGLFFACDLGFFHWALTLTSIAQATLIVNLAPLVALGAGYALFGERLGKAKLGGLFLAIGGAALMTAGKAGVPGAISGNVLAFMGMLGYAFYLIIVKRVRVRHDPATILLGSSVVAAAALFMAAGVSGETLLPGTATGLMILVAMGVGTHALGQGLVAIGIGRAPVGLASILLLMQPVVAAIAAWGLFGETLQAIELGGAVLVLFGMGLASRAKG